MAVAVAVAVAVASPRARAYGSLLDLDLVLRLPSACLLVDVRAGGERLESGEWRVDYGDLVVLSWRFFFKTSIRYFRLYLAFPGSPPVSGLEVLSPLPTQ